MQRYRAKQLLSFQTSHSAITPLTSSQLAQAAEDGNASELVKNYDQTLIGLIQDACIDVDGNKITWVGRWEERPINKVGKVIKAKVVLPGWIDAHTHALFGGSRAQDFWRRNAGISYEELLHAGGGIHATVQATKAASDEELLQLLSRRFSLYYHQGMSAIEVKASYALDLKEELRHLRLIKKAAKTIGMHVTSTSMAGHVIPPKFKNDRDGYIEMITKELLPHAVGEKLVDQVDVFCDQGAFTVDEARKILLRAKDLGLAGRIHAEQLAKTGAAALAAELSLATADHLEHVSNEDIKKMAKADVVGGLLPLCGVFLPNGKKAPARKMLEAGMRISVATDFNPGSAHSQNLHLAASLACSQYHLTPGEALRAVTRVPAEALGIFQQFGSIETGKSARMLCFNVNDWHDILWYLTLPPRLRRWL